MATHATTYPKPLCACCEHALADLREDGQPLRDRDLQGAVCIDCLELLATARRVLWSVGLQDCQALGPGPHISGGLGS